MIHDQSDCLLKHGIAISELDPSKYISFNEYRNPVSHVFLLNLQ